MTPSLDIPRDRPILIAGTTASGKSAYAMALAERDGGIVVNADALQVFSNWRILTARPTPEDEARVPHRLYGHVPAQSDYSVGHWLADLRPLLQGERPIIVGGTGLYFKALTEGLAEVPMTPSDIRQQGDKWRAQEGHAGMLAELDPATRSRIDTANPMRVQRAWEVLRATGRGLAAWQDDTPAPLLAPGTFSGVVVTVERDLLNRRIDARFDRMLDQGVIEEARQNLAGWNAERPAARAIGAPELIAHLRGEITLAQASEAAKIATRQYAKRQRTWLRARMRDWHVVQNSEDGTL